MYIVQGENDSFHSPDEVRKILNKSTVDFEIFDVPDAGHGLLDTSGEFQGQNAVQWYVEKLKILTIS